MPNTAVIVHSSAAIVSGVVVVHDGLSRMPYKNKNINKVLKKPLKF